jgi:hypothetical protein
MIFLTAGAIVNIAVAWTAINLWRVWLYTGTPPPVTPMSHGDSALILSRYADPSWSEVSVRGSISNYPAFEAVIVHSTPVNPNWEFYRGRSGFPLYALAGQVDFTPARTQAIGWMQIGSLEFHFCPLWLGFVINTIVYAAILWLLFVTPRKVRQSIRRRRGLCPTCAYPIGTSKVCTECGLSVATTPN